MLNFLPSDIHLSHHRVIYHDRGIRIRGWHFIDAARQWRTFLSREIQHMAITPLEDFTRE